jgi:hypothetical protein
MSMAATAAVVALVAPAQAEMVDITWDMGNRFERRMDVAPGRFAEACGRLANGDKVSWSFEGSAPMDFNVHYHEGKAVVFPVRQNGVAAARGTLSAEMPQDYCWMWTNESGKTVTLRLLMTR